MGFEPPILSYEDIRDCAEEFPPLHHRLPLLIRELVHDRLAPPVLGPVAWRRKEED